MMFRRFYRDRLLQILTNKIEAMQTSKNNRNDEDYRERSGQSLQSGSSLGNDNYTGQDLNRGHSDNVRAGEHNYRQDETQYGKIRESEAGIGSTEKRAENLRDKVNEGVHQAGEKVHDYSNRAENKMGEWTEKAGNKIDEWTDKAQDKMDDLMGKSNSERAQDKYEKAEKKMDKAEKKMDKAEDKFAKGYENDGRRKMEKAEKKMDKAEEKIQDAHEELDRNTGTYRSPIASGNDHVEDYQNRAGQGNPFDNTHPIDQGNVR